MSQDPKSKLQSNGTDFTPTIHHDTYDRINPEQWDLSGKAAFVTGASKGVGRATTLSYARAGVSMIAIGARSDLTSLEKEIQEAAQKAGKKAPKTLSLKLDVASEESVANAAKEIEAAFGRLDILINNAGYLETFRPIAESKIDEWRHVWEINSFGVFLVTRAFLPLMLKGGMKTILNLSSIGANSARPGASGYQIGKLGIIRFSEFINSEYGDQGILSYSIHPGGVPTELANKMPEAVKVGLVDKVELGADMTVWLTAERREWLAGRYIAVNWDVDELLGKKEKIVKEDLLKVRLDVGLE